MARWLVKEIAEAKGVTRYRLAKDTGMPFQSIDAIWQNEAQRIDRTTLDKLAKALDVTPRDLIGNDGGEAESDIVTPVQAPGWTPSLVPALG